MQLIQGWEWVLSLQKTSGSKLLQGEAKYDPISDSTVFVGVLFVFSIMYENRMSGSDTGCGGGALASSASAAPSVNTLKLRDDVGKVWHWTETGTNY